jgi:hypothetical protein
MFGDADRELEPDALVPREKRQISMCGGRADDLDLGRGFQGAKCGDNVAVRVPE